MNKWQEIYKGDKNRLGYDLLGKMKSIVIVHHKDFTGINGFIPAHTEELTITEDDCDIPNGKISVDVLVGNLELWSSRGYKMETR